MERDDASEKFEDASLHEVDIETLRLEFKRLRKARKLSQSETGKLLNVSQATISSFEKGNYSNQRKKTLNGIRKLVQFWQRDAERIVQGDFPERQIVSVPDHYEAGTPVSPACPHCHTELPRSEAPFPYCPFCREALGLKCECGHVVEDTGANFCSRCCRLLAAEGADLRPYALLEDENERLRAGIIRKFLGVLDGDGGIGALREAAKGDVARATS